MSRPSDASFEKWAEQVGARVASCAGCSSPVSRGAPIEWRAHRLAGRIKGRPYCHPCLRASRPARGR